MILVRVAMLTVAASVSYEDTETSADADVVAPPADARRPA
jgi:hypothetical protein